MRRSKWVAGSVAVTAAVLMSTCGGSDGVEANGQGAEQSESKGTGVLTVDGVDYGFDVLTCELDGYENEGVAFDFDVAGTGSSGGRSYNVFARRSYHADTDWWIEVIDLDYADGADGLHALHGFSAETSEPFIFDVGSSGVQVDGPVEFVSDLVDETPAGEGTIVVDCRP